jgi:hypothetical protein
MSEAKLTPEAEAFQAKARADEAAVKQWKEVAPSFPATGPAAAEHMPPLGGAHLPVEQRPRLSRFYANPKYAAGSPAPAGYVLEATPTPRGWDVRAVAVDGKGDRIARVTMLDAQAKNADGIAGSIKSAEDAAASFNRLRDKLLSGGGVEAAR